MTMQDEDTADAARDRDPDRWLTDALNANAETIDMIEKATDALTAAFESVLEETINVPVDGAKSEEVAERTPSALMVRRVVEQRRQLRRIHDKLMTLKHQARIG